ncbi:TIGR01906 family membrane protein [Clostridium sp. chh4-2]|uniref:TIGR01906 family membrane protein n=1 Tax=Clostridium sp. chh4-2 TaxID=2067550 RepID=UPI000CCE9CBA|nr:TIGR01906 family membrane protein [Clostridium sp. chh4-2]PNV61514.1 TIGR01906 family membrane protein [Clostridium sp. chh4-2]
MKIIQYILGILTAFCLMIILLITSVEAVTYWTPGFYEKEYAKYGVTEDVHMEMDDLLDVTHEMMSFLRGNREDLHVMTVVNGQPREFFNEREIAHMEDVKGLFIGALLLRRICLLTAAVSLVIMFLLKGRAKSILPKTLCIGTGLFFAVLLVLAGIISTDFSKYFIVFHHIFFNNDLWILDPATDLLINIVPEPFFMDTAARIGITYGISVIVLFLACLYFVLRGKNKKH